MIILALDTSAATASVAVCRDGVALSRCDTNNGMTHSQNIMRMVDFVVISSGVAMSEIDMFALTIGPGSYTGVRIGVATIKGLAMALRKPVVQVGTLDALAYGGVARFASNSAQASQHIVCAMIDARRDRVYNAVYLADGGNPCGGLVQLRAPRVILLQDLMHDLQSCVQDSGAQNIFFVGDGAKAHQSSIAESFGSGAQFSSEQGVNAVDVAKLAAANIDAAVNHDEVKPFYLQNLQIVAPVVVASK